MNEPILYEQHMHTPLCRHSVGEIEDYAAIAQQRGLKGIVVTCHNPLPDGIGAEVRMREEQWDEYQQSVQRARETWAGKIDVRLGLEADFWPELVPFLERQLQSADFHHVLGSIHPQMRAYRERFYNGDLAAYIEQYFEHLAQAAESGLFDTLSHPDLIKNELAAQWSTKRVLPIIERALDRIAKTNTAMELNTSGLNKALPEMNPGPLILRAMCERNIPVVIGADAHTPGRVADKFETALDLLHDAGYSHTFVTIDRKRTPVPMEIARASLRPLPVASTWQKLAEQAKLGATIVKQKIVAN